MFAPVPDNNEYTNTSTIAQLQQQLTEKELLLSLNTRLSHTRHRTELMQLIKATLQQLFYFYHCTICIVNKDKTTFRAFLLDPQSKMKAHDEYDTLVTREFPVKDGLVDVTLASATPVVFELGDMVQAGIAPWYVTVMHQSGIHQMMNVTLAVEGEQIGLISFYSDIPGKLTSNQFSTIQAVAAQVALAVKNVMTTENMEKREKQRETLLAISDAIAQIKNREGLLQVLNNNLKQLFNFTYSLVLKLSDNQCQVSTFLLDPDSRSRSDPEYRQIVTSQRPVNDGIFNKVLASRRAVLLHLEKEANAPEAPDYVKMNYRSGMKEAAAIALRSGNQHPIGIIVLYSDTLHHFTTEMLDMLQGVMFHLSTALANVLYHEAIAGSNKEKAFRLSFTRDLARVQRKQELLSLINARLREHMHFTHSSIGIINENKQTFRIYITDPGSVSRTHPLYARVTSTELPLNDGVAGTGLVNEQPNLFKLEDLISKGNVPDYITINYEQGIKEMLFVPLLSSNGNMGSLCLHADRTDNFSQDNLLLLKNVSGEIAIAVSNVLALEELRRRDEEKSVLLELGAYLATVRDKTDWLQIVNSKLKKLFPFRHSVMGIVTPDKQHYTGYIIDPGSLSKNHSSYNSIVFSPNPIRDGIFDVAAEAGIPVVFDLDEVSERIKLPPYLQMNYEKGVKTAMVSILHNDSGPFCCFIMFSTEKNSFSQYARDIVQGISHHLSTAVSNIIANEEIKKKEAAKSMLYAFSSALAAVRKKEEVAEVIHQHLKNSFLIKQYILSILSDDKTTHSYFLYDLSGNYYNNEGFEKIKNNHFAVAGGMASLVLAAAEPVNINIDQLLAEGRISFPNAAFWKSMGVDWILGTQLRAGDDVIGILWSQPDQINLPLIKSVAAQIAIAIQNIIANNKIEQQLEEINGYRRQLEEENMYLQEEVSSGYSYSDIIGTGPGMQKVFHLLSQVSPASSTVLILGETGTGKELIARAIHNASLRRDKLLIKVNCAALPANLIESELFGHEKGSFTGAVERRIGKFELANNSTIFLDEIGEMPLDLQVKLLRALQEKEIERVGGKGTIKTDVRVIAATNRDLQKEVEEGRFRPDLFYRLNVFPILLPPLRERKEDIPVLVTHFIQKYAKNTGKKIHNIAAGAMKELLAYEWPGNIRELEHLLERSILTTQGAIIKKVHLPADNRESIRAVLEEGFLKTHEENERDHILQVLNACKGKIFGAGGAAEILGLHVSTLNSKIKKLGIVKGKTIFKSTRQS